MTKPTSLWEGERLIDSLQSRFGVRIVADGIIGHFRQVKINGSSSTHVDLSTTCVVAKKWPIDHTCSKGDTHDRFLELVTPPGFGANPTRVRR